MTSISPANRKGTSCQSAYTLPEVMVGVSIIAVMFVTLYLGFTQGFGVVQASRENLRATQILQQQAEVIRLYTWDQLTNGTIPSDTTWTFYPMGAPGSKGVTYTGKIQVTAAPMVDEAYVADHRQVVFTLTWRSGNVQRQRLMSTLVSKYGLHNYIYNPQGTTQGQ